jgi:putative endonuclease
MDCESRWCVYVVECSDGTYYTGISVDVDRRIGQHNLGRGAKYTRPRLPVVLIHSEGPMTRSEALRREIEIKRMQRDAKRRLVEVGRE